MAGNITIGNMTSLDAGNVTSTLLVPVVKPGTLTNYHTQLGNLSGAVGIEITDGTHDVTGATKLTVTGGTVGGTTPNATLTISGGSPSITLTAGTDLAAGTGVAVNGSGEAAQTWGPAPNIAGIVQPFGAVKFISPAVSALQLDTTDFVLFGNNLYNYGASGGGAITATISGESISLGTLNTSAVLASVGISEGAPPVTPNAAALSSSLFVVVYVTGGDLTVAACSVAGGVITVGTGVQVDAQSAEAISVTALSATSFAISYFGADGNAWVVVGAVSGTTVTLGSLVEVLASATNIVNVETLSSTSVVIVYTDAANIYAVIGTVVGTVITLGSPATIFTAPNIGYPQIAVLSATLFVITCAGSNQNSVVPLFAASVSGTTITSGGEVDVIFNGFGNGPWVQPLTSTTFLFIGSFGVAPLLGTVSGTTITISPPNELPAPSIVMNSAGGAVGGGLGVVGGVAVLGAGSFIFTDNFGSIYQQTAGKLSGSIKHQVNGYWFYTVDSTRALALIWNTDLTMGIRVIGATSNISTGPIGLTASAVTSGNPATIQQSGSCSGFSGLTVNAQYYFNGDGTITTANTGHPAGVALTTSTLAINMAG